MTTAVTCAIATYVLLKIGLENSRSDINLLIERNSECHESDDW